MTKNSTKTISKLFFEFIIIVIGVLTAFGLQELSQSISDEKQKSRYLNSVKSELLENKDRLQKLITRNRDQDLVTDSLVSYLKKKFSTDTTKLFEGFLDYGALSFKLGAYEALKNSSSFDKLDNIELTTKLNNLVGQVESTLEFQRQIENLNADLFVIKNNDMVDPVNRKILSARVFAVSYLNDIKQLQRYRKALIHEFELIQANIEELIKLIDVDLK